MILHFSLPEGLGDVSKFPDLIAELLRRNYTEEEVKKVVGENLIRVFEKAEEVSVIMCKCYSAYVVKNLSCLFAFFEISFFVLVN